MTKKLLLHHCCVVCSPKVMEFFRQKFSEVTGYWFNSNIYPDEEHNRRLNALQTFAEIEKYPVIVESSQSFQFEEFSEHSLKRSAGEKASDEEMRCRAQNHLSLRGNPSVSEDTTDRCKFCYNLRLSQTAKVAKTRNIKYFSTTLLASPYQKHELVKQIGEKVSSDVGVEFVYRDFRVVFYDGKNIIRELKLYIQKYCGCSFSLEDRLSQEAV